MKGKRTYNNQERFIRAIASGVNDESNFDNAYKIQTYLEYSVRSNARRTPIKVEQRSLTSG